VICNGNVLLNFQFYLVMKGQGKGLEDRNTIYNTNVLLNFQFYLVMKGKGKDLEDSDI
jgi:hypothetical protein